MTYNRRSFIRTCTGGLCIASVGCSYFDDVPCTNYFVNLTGRSLKGTFKIGSVFSEYLIGSTLATLPSTARISIISGEKCVFSGKDIYSNETIVLSSMIPTAPHPDKPASCGVFLTENLTIESQWGETYQTYPYEYVHELYSQKHKTIPAIINFPETNILSKFGLRQRPVSFTAYGLTRHTDRFGKPRHSMFTWLLSPQESPFAVFGFSSSSNLDHYDHYRLLIDLRTIPMFENTDDGLWVEIENLGTIKIGRFSNTHGGLEEIESALKNGSIVPPRELRSFSAAQHPAFTTFFRGESLTMELLDLRFDDEIEAQGLESPVRS